MNVLEYEERVAERAVGSSPLQDSLRRYIPLTIWMIVSLTLLLVPLRIISYGFLPVGDARRHVAKAFTEKSYRDIIVMQPGYSMDHSPGWEWLLKRIQRATGWTRDGLAAAAIVITMICVLLVALPFLGRPEAWLAALLTATVAMPELMSRYAQARPYLITGAVLIAILFSWSKASEENPSRWKLVLTCLGIGASVWIHGAWYLWCLPITAFLLAQRWRSGAWLAACWSIGTVTGAALTGRPVEFLKEGLFIGMAVAQQQAASWMLVWEFRPHEGQVLAVLVLAIVCLFRRQIAPALNPCTGPVFWLIVLGWILGFKSTRFWQDWGLAAFMVWLALQAQDTITTAWDGASPKRLLVCVFLAIPVFLHTTNDLDRRYTASLNDVFLDARQPALSGWMPQPGGILYSASMEVFFHTFYANPNGDWRYILGMEAALMPEEDQKILRQIQLSRYAASEFEPWVRKMHPADRLAIQSSLQPAIPGLEWTNAVGNTWLGRLPGPGEHIQRNSR